MGLQWVLHCYGSVSGISPLFSLAALEYLQEGDAGFPLQIHLWEQWFYLWRMQAGQSELRKLSLGASNKNRRAGGHKVFTWGKGARAGGALVTLPCWVLATELHAGSGCDMTQGCDTDPVV